MIRILHSADWHVGPRKGPEKDGVNLREADTYKCLDTLVETAEKTRPDFTLVPGDLFDVAAVGQGRSHREVLKVREIIQKLANYSDHVIVMRGTPNHDSAEAFEELKAHFEKVSNVKIITEPKLLKFDDEGVNIAVVPGFDAGVFRAKYPGLSKEEENEAFTQELANLITGLKAECDTGAKTILMAHNTVPGCNTEAGQNTFLQNFEPVITSETLHAADYDLMCLGHIHRPQELPNVPHCFYSGAINALNFNDEGQERGFWVHGFMDDGSLESQFVKTPYRHFQTIRLGEEDIRQINVGAAELVGATKWIGKIDNKIVRILYRCDEDANKAFNHAEMERYLYMDGAFYVWDISPERIEQSANRKDMDQMSPEDNLREYLEDKGYDNESIERLVQKARPIISTAIVDSNTSALIGIFTPISIEVKNYRNYEEESFDFRDIRFCTINGQNGAGKSSLFMDAILDCLWEETREGDLTGWIRNDEKARSGSISFTFSIGDKFFRVTRTRAKSGKATLNLSEQIEGEWVNRSKERFKDTQDEITKLVGMDSMTFKSCALIMQDQYGLFLEAPKDARMQILSNILGLGIYGSMEKLAWDEGRQHGAKMRAAQAEVKVHEQTIDSYGNPKEELATLTKQMQELKAEQEAVTAEKDKITAGLNALKLTMERRDTLQASITTFEQKKTEIEASVKAQQDVIDASRLILDSEPMLNQKAEEYSTLEKRKQEMASDAAVYQAKLTQLHQIIDRSDRLSHQIEEKEAQIERKKQEQESLNATENVDDITSKAAEYAKKKAEYDRMTQDRQKYLIASQKVRDARTDLSREEDSWTAKEQLYIQQRESLKRQTQLLDDSGCVDIEHANCRFLQSAIAAKEKLSEMEAQYEEMMNAKEADLNTFTDAVKQAEGKLLSLHFDEEAYRNLAIETSNLLEAAEKAKKLEEQRMKLSSLKASIEADESALADLNKQSEAVITEQDQAMKDCNQYKAASDALAQIETELAALQKFVDQHARLPIYKERLANASERIKDMNDRISDLTAAIAEKKLELADLVVSLSGYKETQDQLALTSSRLNGINLRLADMQKQAGGYEQKISEIERLESGIQGLRATIKELSVETADFDTLKAAFSQDGIPHQIVRSILPKLASTANTILSQMTGGKMSLDFQTEKTLKSNSKKEVETLDILITESGKPTLPYLSKSGGEKVKASLSVILALSEVKSEAAGTQLGMLFIDEPPFLDSEGIEAYCDSLETIQMRYPNIKIMAITHDPRMKARFPQSITVTKDEHGSHVQWD